MEASDLQLKVLKKLDPSIISYFFISTFSTIHEIDEATSQFHDLDFQGCLYLAKYQAKATSVGLNYKLILLNRKKKDDFQEEITDLTDFKFLENYVYLRQPLSNQPISSSD